MYMYVLGPGYAHPGRQSLSRAHQLRRGRVRIAFNDETRLWTRFSLADILVLVGGAIPPAPAVPASILGSLLAIG